MKRFPLLVLLFSASFGLLTVYSFSQVDLNLTLSSLPLYQAFQAVLTNLGYFHRPLSTFLYLNIILLFTISYALLAIFARQKKISSKQIWLLVFLAVIILLPSYPAFSHDVFNYLFDARIVTKYGLSPWHYKALDFPADEWIRFMRWTHRLTPYPPIWIGLSLIPSFLGFGKFVITLGLFKLMAAFTYLGSSLLILRISRQLKRKNPLKILALFALNPLVVIESLINAHIEITMVFFGLLAINLMLKKRKVLSWSAYIASVGIKLMTAYLVLVLVKGKKYLRHSIWLGIAATLSFIAWRDFQPWYILWVFPFSLLLKQPSWESQLLILASISALFWNIPRVLVGDFNLPDPTTRLLYVIIPLAVTGSIFSLKYVSMTKRSN